MKLSQSIYQQAESEAHYGASGAPSELSQWLTTIDIGWEGNLSDLRELSIYGIQLRRSNITSIPEFIFQTQGNTNERLTNLHKLTICATSLTSIPESIGQLINLKELNLRRNQLTSLPDSIGQLVNLQNLDLANNQLTSLSDSIFQLTNLQRLDLMNNSLISLPESLGQLTNLKYLYLRGSRLTSIPDWIGQLTSLQCLVCHKNRQLTNISESIGKVTNLQELSFTGTSLTSIPESIGQLTNLQDLDISDNHLTSIPEAVGQLINLKKLDLSNNQITDLSPLQRLNQKNLQLRCFNLNLPRRYWTKFSDWQPEWLLDEDNAEIRQVLIQQVGYEKICERLGAETSDNWREYILLKIEADIDLEPIVLLKMTCPSTQHIHILRVPPEIISAEDAITWVNHGIHPDNIAIQT
jgi:leucine-rich repeat protein SHOC2